MSIIWLVPGVLVPAPAPRSLRGQGQGSDADGASEELAVDPQLLGRHDHGQSDHGDPVAH